MNENSYIYNAISEFLKTHYLSELLQIILDVVKDEGIIE